MVDVVGSASIEISPSLEGFVRDLEARLRAVDVDYTVNVEADTASAEAQLAALRDDTTIEIDVDVDGDFAEARLDELTRDRTVNIDTDSAVSGLQRVVSSADSAHRSLSNMSMVKYGALATGIAGLIPVIGGVAAAAGAAGGAIAAIGGVIAIGGAGIVDTFSAMGDTSSAAGAEKFAEALGKLAPNAREFVLAMRDLGPAWGELRSAVQDNLFAGLGEQVTQLANQHLPALKDGVSQVAGALNTALKDTLGQLGDLFTRLEESGAWQAFIDAVSQSLSGMAPFLTNVVEGLTNLTTIVGPTIGPLFAALGEGLNAISGPLGSLGAEFVTQITNLMPTLAAFISALAQGLQPVLPVLQELLTALGNALIPIIPYLSNFLQIIGNALVAALPVVSGLLVQLLNALSPLFQESGIGNQVLATMAQLFSDLITAITPVVQEIVNNLQPLIPILSDAFRQIAPVIGDVAIALGTALANALRDVGPLLPGLIESFTNMLVELTPLLPKLTEFALEILPPLTDAAVKLADPLQKLLDLFAAIFDWVDKLVGPLIRVTDALNSVTDNAVTRALLSTLGPFGATAGALMDSGGGGGDTGRRVGAHDFGDSGMGDAGSGGGGGAVSSMTSIVQSRFPGMQMTSGYRNEPGSYHSTGQAADFSNGTDDTPEMQALANYIADNYLSQTLELIHSPFGRNIKNGRFVGDGMNLYGASTMAEHRNHVHWAVAGPVGAPQRGPTYVPGQSAPGQSAPTVSPTGTYVGPGAPGSGAYLNGGVGNALTTYPQADLPGRTSDKELQTRLAQSRVDEANSKRNAVYANPNATQADKDAADLAYLQAQNSLESSQKSGQTTAGKSDLSLQGFGAKAGTIAANAVLGFFGLQNSILSSSNPYNRAANSVIDFYSNQQQPGVSGGYGYTPQNLPQSTYQGASPGSAYSGVAPGGATANGVTPNGVTPNYTPGTVAPSVGGVKGAVQGAFSRYGWGSGAQWEAADWIINKESGYNPAARNPSSGAYGIGQFLGHENDKYGAMGAYSNDPALQGAAMAEYIKDRYGDPVSAKAFWEANGWYDNGGIASGVGVMLKNVISPERVLDPEMTRSFDTKLIPILESMRGWSPRAPEVRRNAPGPVDSGPRVAFYGTNVADYRGLVETAEREAHKASAGVLAAL